MGDGVTDPLYQSDWWPFRKRRSSCWVKKWTGRFWGFFGITLSKISNFYQLALKVFWGVVMELEVGIVGLLIIIGH